MIENFSNQEYLQDNEQVAKMRCIDDLKHSLSLVEESTGLEKDWNKWKGWADTAKLEEIISMLSFVNECIENSRKAKETYDLCSKLKESNLLSTSALKILEGLENKASSGNKEVNENFREFVLFEYKRLPEIEKAVLEYSAFLSVSGIEDKLEGFVMKFTSKTEGDFSMKNILTKDKFKELSLRNKQEYLQKAKEYVFKNDGTQETEHETTRIDVLKKAMLEDKTIPESWKIKAKVSDAFVDELYSRKPELNETTLKYQEELNKYTGNEETFSISEFQLMDIPERNAEINRISNMNAKNIPTEGNIMNEVNEETDLKYVSESIKNSVVYNRVTNANEAKTILRNGTQRVLSAGEEMEREDNLIEMGEILNMTGATREEVRKIGMVFLAQDRMSLNNIAELRRLLQKSRSATQILDTLNIKLAA